jgi:hypothetical protein
MLDYPAESKKFDELSADFLDSWNQTGIRQNQLHLDSWKLHVSNRLKCPTYPSW